VGDPGSGFADAYADAYAYAYARSGLSLTPLTLSRGRERGPDLEPFEGRRR
jgi:hypothetical protein